MIENSMSSIVGLTGSIFEILIYVVIGLFFVGMGLLFFFFFKYDKKVVIRKKINGKNKIFYDKARLVEEDGVMWWKLLKRKKKIPVPPHSAVEIDRKGKDFCEFYELETGEFIPMIDDNSEINSVKPFTSNQRQLLQGQFKKAHLEKGFRLNEHIGAMTFVAALVIIIISLMVFYGDMAKPLLEQGKSMNKMMDKQIEMQKQLNVMVENIADLQSEVIESNYVVNQPRNVSIRGVPN